MSTKVSSSGRLATASEQMSVCSSSDLPEPVVPAMSACGPSSARSISNGPSGPTPITARVVRPQPAAIRAGSAGPMRSSSRTDPGRAAAGSSRLTSRSGASARASRSAHAGDTRSARIPAVASGPPPSNRTVPSAAQESTAVHSSGRSRSSSSIAIV